MLNKKGEGFVPIIFGIAGVLFIVFLLDYMGIVDIGGIGAVQPPTQGPSAPTVGNLPYDTASCGTPSSTLTLGPLKAKWNPTTSMSTLNIREFEVNPQLGSNGLYTWAEFNAQSDSGSKADSSTDTVAINTKLGLINGYGSTAYYSKWQEFYMPCGATQSASMNNGANELVANGSATIDVFNSDTGNKNAGTSADNETIASGEEGRFDFATVSTGYKTGLSSEGKIKVVIEVNKSAYQEELTTFGSLTPSTTPTFYTLSNTDSTTRTFEAPGCPIGTATSCNEDWGQLKVKAEATANPATTGASTSLTATIGGGGIRVCLFDEDWGLHTITGVPVYGAELDDGTSNGMFGTGGQCILLSVG